MTDEPSIVKSNRITFHGGAWAEIDLNDNNQWLQVADYDQGPSTVFSKAEAAALADFIKAPSGRVWKAL